jgi:hypothetical protein
VGRYRSRSPRLPTPAPIANPRTNTADGPHRHRQYAQVFARSADRRHGRGENSPEEKDRNGDPLVVKPRASVGANCDALHIAIPECTTGPSCRFAPGRPGDRRSRRERGVTSIVARRAPSAATSDEQTNDRADHHCDDEDEDGKHDEGHEHDRHRHQDQGQGRAGQGRAGQGLRGYGATGLGLVNHRRHYADRSDCGIHIARFSLTANE